MQHVLIHKNLLKKLIQLRSEVDKLDIYKLNVVPTSLNSWKSKVDKLGFDKLVPVPVDLSKLSDVAKNVVLKKDAYNAKLKNPENSIPDITKLANPSLNSKRMGLKVKYLVLLTQLLLLLFNAKINEGKGEIHSITNLDTTTALIAKVNEVKNKIPNITNLAMTTALTAVENKTPDQDKYISLLQNLIS